MKNSKIDIASAPQLIIFDCDGVLVESEAIATGTLEQVCAPYGLIMSNGDALQLFRGQKLDKSLAYIEAQIGRDLPSDIVTIFRAALYEALAKDVEAIPGIKAALDQITVPICVASSGPRRKIELTLNCTGLLARFEGRIFSAYEIGSWKPEPGLFLEAARVCGAVPASCVVVEDSLPGVQAGLAAKMRVLAYVPDGDLDDFAAMGATTFTSMSELPELITGFTRRLDP